MIKHHFFGLDCKIDRQLSDHSDLEKNLKEKNWQFENINFVNQIHSEEVYIIDCAQKIQAKQGLVKADAIVTNQKNLVIGIVTADCCPIIIKDENCQIVAIIHAGWRGAKKGVIQNTIDQMVKMGSCVNSMQAFIGPMIYQDSYQVSQEFYDEFILQNGDNAQFFKKDQQLAKYLFDLVTFVEDILCKKDVKKIDNITIDTYRDKSYASYRRSFHEGQSLEVRNISVVMI